MRWIVLCIVLLAIIPLLAEAEPLYHRTGDAIEHPLAAKQGDAARGRAVFIDRQQGHCVLCHQITGLDVPFQGNVGPPLGGIGSRLTAGQIRLRLADSAALNKQTIMPPYYRTHGLNQLTDDSQGQTVLNAQQIEDLVAYLTGLKVEARK